MSIFRLNVYTRRALALLLKRAMRCGMRWRVSRVWWALVVVAVFATACSGATDSAEPEQPASGSDSGDGAETSELGVDTTGTVAVIDQDLDWQRCLENLECTTVVVPLDYDDPTGETTELAVTRWVSEDPEERIGTLFVNPGGPGFGADFLVDSLANFAILELGIFFDIVGIDPRGTGSSNPIDCNSDWVEDINTSLTEADGLADDVEAFIADFQEMGAECLEEHGAEYLASITTENAARDHEAVRILLGDEPMNFMGASYGTTLGSVYATMFPDNLRSLVLDGAVLPDAGLLSPDEAEDVQLQLERIEASCDAWEDCALNGQGWIESFDALEAKLIDGPIGPLTLGEFQNVAGLAIAAPSFMGDVAFGVSEALDGDGTSLSELSNFLLTPLPETGNPAEFAGGLPAIHCADGIEWSMVESAQVLQVAEETAAANPDLGPFFGIPCDQWPVHGDGLPAIDYRGTAPVLVIGNTGDAVTPVRYAAEMVGAFGDRARLLTWDATGHVAFGFGSNCIDTLTLDYLVDLVLPPDGTVCPLEGLLGVELEEDLTILDVGRGSTADALGIEVGDRILSVDGVEISTFFDLPRFAAGQTDVLVLERDGEQVQVEATFDLPEWELWRQAE